MPAVLKQVMGDPLVMAAMCVMAPWWIVATPSAVEDGASPWRVLATNMSRAAPKEDNVLVDVLSPRSSVHSCAL